MAQATGRTPGTAGLGAAGVAVTLATVLTNGLAYLVPMLGARQLGAADLSALATVLALGAIAGVPGTGLQLAVAVHRARHGRPRAGRLALVTAAVTGSALVLAAPLIASTLRLPLELVGLLAAMTVAVVLAGRWLGELQGGQLFVRLAAGMAVLAAGRYGGLIAGLWGGAGLTWSLLLGAVTTALALPVLARLTTTRTGLPTPAPTKTGPPTPVPTRTGPPTLARATLSTRQVVTASSATLAMLTVSYADLLLARQVLPVTASAGYAVGTVLTKGALWAPQVITVIALPRLAAGDRSARLAALGLVSACGAVLITAAALAGDLAFRLAGGSAYADLARYAPFFAATGALYALVFVLVNAQIASAARYPAAPLWVAGGVLAGGTLLIAPATIEGVLGCAVSVAAATAAVMIWVNGRTPGLAGRTDPDRPLTSGADTGPG